MYSTQIIIFHFLFLLWHLQDTALWGCLAAMALQGRHLDTAEIALAALNEVDKLEFILHVKKIPSEEGRSAELAVYRRCPDEAEAILLQVSELMGWLVNCLIGGLVE
jgi:hypothetical protein